MSDEAAREPGDEPAERQKPLIPRRTATANQAVVAIGLVFLIGVLIGFVLARTL